MEWRTLIRHPCIACSFNSSMSIPSKGSSLLSSELSSEVSSSESSFLNFFFPPKGFPLLIFPFFNAGPLFVYFLTIDRAAACRFLERFRASDSLSEEESSVSSFATLRPFDGITVHMGPAFSSELSSDDRSSLENPSESLVPPPPPQSLEEALIRFEATLAADREGRLDVTSKPSGKDKSLSLSNPLVFFALTAFLVLLAVLVLKVFCFVGFFFLLLLPLFPARRWG
mmetsp:Transcript_16491/g.41379  ORF Transcript_16491/g.41379 Transcript_16491/m.41379 type:complete len:227 (-) Transcript_16491:1174-1854(-)